MKKIVIRKEGILAQFLRTEYKGKKNIVRLADEGWAVDSTIKI